VGLYSPLPPVRSGVADYAAALLGALGGDVVVGADGDVNLYQMGNNGLHAGIYERALARPGVVVLHDAVLHHFHLGYLDRARYVEEFVYCYGGWYRGMAEELWAGRAASGAAERYFRWPMVKRLAERALAVVVHNEGAAAMVRREAPGTRVEVIPHLPLAAPAVDGVAVERWRVERGVAPSHTLFGVMGYLRESKRVMAVLRVFARLRERRKDVWLLLAGEAGGSDLARAMAFYDGAEGVVREGHLGEVEFQMRAAACDVGVNLRYPAAGESSGLTARWLRLGRPVLVSDAAENRELPEAACPRVATGLGEEEELEALMEWMAESAVRRRECGRLGAEWAGEAMRLEAIAERYWRVLRECREAGCRVGRPVGSG
jgi:glycosyltransferase involved in cell wall biosynthesis